MDKVDLLKELEKLQQQIVELQDGDSKYKELFDNMQNGVALHEIVLDENGKPTDYIFEEVNRAFEEQTGLKRENLIGKKVTEAIPGIKEDPADWIGTYGQVVLDGKTISFENYSEMLDRWYSVIAYRHGQRQFVTIFFDITTRKKAEREREELQKFLFHSAKLASIGELAAGVGHEINNPLAIIQGNIERVKRELIAKDNYSELLQEYLESQADSIFRISAIVDGLRIYARTDSDELQSIDIHQEIGRSVGLVKVMYEKESIRLDTSLLADESCIMGNGGKLQQVVMNLLSNAKDAMEGRDKKEICVNTRNEGDKIIIEVRDSGAGIPSGIQDKIFETYFTTKEIGKGTGMGLGISFAIVEEFGGRIDVESTVGVGTVFSISFPRVQVCLLNQEKKQDESEVEPQLSGKALVIDDEEGIREILALLLEELGLEVDTADDGDTALEKVKEIKYDYICTDMQMLRMSGEEFIREARKLPNGDTLYFIITGGITVDYTSDDRDKSKDLADGYVQKPFSEEALRDVLLEATKKK